MDPVISQAATRTEAGYTLDQLASKVGMSPRNIRAHQARRLLAPPVRRGRQAVYDDTHVRRLEAITALQRQGFNLVSIEAMLGVRRLDSPTEPLTALLHRLMTERPALVHALSRHSVVGRADDGTIRAVRPRALRSAMELSRARLGAVPALQILTEVLDSLRPVADELVNAVTARTLALAPDAGRPGPGSSDEFDHDAVVLTQGLIGLLTEAFRVAVEQHAGRRVLELIDQRMDVDLRLTGSATVDNG